MHIGVATAGLCPRLSKGRVPGTRVKPSSPAQQGGKCQELPPLLALHQVCASITPLLVLCVHQCFCFTSFESQNSPFRGMRLCEIAEKPRRGHFFVEIGGKSLESPRQRRKGASNDKHVHYHFEMVDKARDVGLKTSKKTRKPGNPRT